VYEVIYTDADGQAPAAATVYIDGVPCAMGPAGGAVESGAVYRYETTLGAAPHDYHFAFSDGTDSARLPASGVYSGPGVTGPGESAYREDFEGPPGNEWSTYRSDTTYGRNALTDYTARSGVNSWRMDVTANGNHNLNELILHVTVSGATYLDLGFHTREYADEGRALPASFSGHYNGDGIAVSSDGVNWTALWQYPPSVGAWTAYSGIDIGAVLNPNGDVYIKFQQYDNYTMTTDGVVWDDIELVSDGTITPAGG
jgi:hypothetical protein